MRLRCKLRTIRGERTLGDISELTGINRGTLSMIELGRLLPKDDQVEALEQAYGAPAHQWYGSRTLLAVEDDEAA